MGNILGRLVELFSGVDDAKILMIGLDSAGKTSILYQLKLDSFINTVPTVGKVTFLFLFLFVMWFCELCLWLFKLMFDYQWDVRKSSSIIHSSHCSHVIKL